MRTSRGGDFAGPGIMLFSALLFGFFGFGYALGLPFGVDWNTPGVDGNPVLFRQMLGWTLKLSAAAFLISALFSFVQPLIANALYSFVGLVGAVLFVIIAVLDVLDTQHGIMVYGPFILLIFAAFNGYGSWQGLRGVLSLRGRRETAAA